MFADRFKLAVEDIFVGHRKTLYYRTEGHYNLVNLNLTADNWFFGADYSLGIYNLFDGERNMIGPAFTDQDVIPMNGRSLMFIVRKTF